MDINTVFIAGSGLMGSGIAQVCAQAGIAVSLYDIDSKALERARRSIEWSVSKLYEKQKILEDTATVMGRITTVTDFSDAQGVDLLIEAVFENLELKREIFKCADDAAGPQALLASNTSAISITELAAATHRPEQVLGLHFFSPVPMMQAVEVIKGMGTSSETVGSGRDFVLKIGKEPIVVNRDVPGFVINRINFGGNMEAMRLVEQGIASVEDIDKGMRLAAGRKMGIFETGDMVGLDVTYGAMMAMYQETGDPRWHPPLILKRKVKAGHLGRKTGKGWYEYTEDGVRKQM